MRLASRLLAFALVASLAFWFTSVNAGERVVVDLVVWRVTAPLPLVVFGSILIGMLSVLFVGLRADLRTRRAVERRRRLANRSAGDLAYAAAERDEMTRDGIEPVEGPAAERPLVHEPRSSPVEDG